MEYPFLDVADADTDYFGNAQVTPQPRYGKIAEREDNGTE